MGWACVVYHKLVLPEAVVKHPAQQVCIMSTMKVYPQKLLYYIHVGLTKCKRLKPVVLTMVAELSGICEQCNTNYRMPTKHGINGRSKLTEQSHEIWAATSQSSWLEADH